MNANPPPAPRKADLTPRQQRARAEIQGHAWMCALMVFTQLWIYGNARLALENGAAAWWSAALCLAGGAAVWLPVQLLLRAHPGQGLCEALTEAAGPWAGGAMNAWLGFLLALDAVLCQFTLIGLCAEFLLLEFTARHIGILTAVGLGATFILGGPVGAARLAFRMRKRLGIGFVLALALLLSNASGSNLFPLAGHGVAPSLGNGLLAGSACCSICVLGFATARAENMPPQGTAHRGSLAGWLALGGCALAIVVMLLGFALAQPPSPGVHEVGWQFRLLMSSSTLNRTAEVRTVFVLLQACLLLIAAQSTLSVSHQALQAARPGLSKRIPQALLCAALLLAAWFYTPDRNRLLLQFLHWRLPAMVLPLWVAWAVDAVRRKRKKGAQNAETYVKGGNV